MRQPVPEHTSRARLYRAVITLFSTLPRDVTLRRLPRLGVGLVAFGAGIGLMVRSDLGLPPWDVLHQGIAMRTPLSMGLATVATSFAVL
ncbi:MAG: hypothetical protein R3236_10065, partial [Phycisphaeraceae bacterium]|nr:hypothetical protein [Phycisphaeraceae bacterium]